MAQIHRHVHRKSFVPLYLIILCVSLFAVAITKHRRLGTL